MKNINHESILSMGEYRDMSIEGIDSNVVESFYVFMLRLRMCQEKILEEYHPNDKMRCPVHFCIGQEAMPAALSALVSSEDYVLSHHRSHGYFFSKGGSVRSLIAEMYGRKTGSNGGLAGSQEISESSLNFFSGAIISGMLAMAVGVGLGFKLKKLPNVAVAVLGDGATDEGLFWEAISYAKLSCLPVIFICENNRYSTYSPQDKRQSGDDIHNRVSAFGLETRVLFGNDVVKSHSVLKEAFDCVKEGKGPFFIETYTYRQKAHVGPEDDDYINYRPKSEREFWAKHCPIKLLESQMEAKGLITKEKKADIVQKINDELSEGFKFAEDSEFPDKPDDWQSLNFCDKDTSDDNVRYASEDDDEFDHRQNEAVPGPY